MANTVGQMTNQEWIYVMENGIRQTNLTDFHEIMEL